MKGLRLALFSAACLMSGSALAHRGHDTLSVVEIDARRGEVVVTHYLAAHDVEPGVLRHVAPDAQPSLDDAQALAALTGYVGENFALRADGAEIALKPDGNTLAGDNIELRYRGPLPHPQQSLQVRASVFADIYPEINNQVNVRQDGVTRTLVFGDGPEWQRVPTDDVQAATHHRHTGHMHR